MSIFFLDSCNQNQSFFKLFVSWIGLLSLALTACQRAPSSTQKIVNLAIWPYYVSAETLKEFEKKTGIKVQQTHYSSNEELLAKLQAGGNLYDVALPADYLILALTKLNLLEPLDTHKIKYFKNLDPTFLGKKYDPENHFSIPYSRGTTGIGVHTFPSVGKILSWKDFFHNPKIAGKISLLDDMREVIGAALKSLGYSLNSTNPAQLEEAKQLLLAFKKSVHAFTSEPIVPLGNREVIVAQAFVTDALQANKISGGKVDYIFPEEGGTLWMDTLVIPKGAPHLKEAYELINFLLEPKVNAFTVTHFFVVPSNTLTLTLLSDSFRKTPALFPSSAVLKNYEMFEDLGEAILSWERIWTEFKSFQPD